jgi:enoyl-[acyl-carrier-protein] reductase (NADH)
VKDQSHPIASSHGANRRIIGSQVAKVARACVFLCSPRSAAITGSAIQVDGGTFMLGQQR